MQKLYPSQEKYLAENPAITCRVKKEEKEKIDLLVKITGKSISQIIRETLFYAEKEYSDVYNKGYEEGHDDGFNDGYDKGKSDWRIWYLCSVCGETIYIIQNSNSHQALIDYMNEHGWGHAECHKKKPSDTY